MGVVNVPTNIVENEGKKSFPAETEVDPTEFIFKGFTGFLVYEHPRVYEKIREVLQTNDVDLSILVLISTTEVDGRPDNFLVRVSTTTALDAVNPVFAEKFGYVERDLPMSESAEPAEATEDLAAAVVERWKAALKP